MEQHNQTEFYLEGLQSDWLPRSWMFRLLCFLLIGLIFGLISGIAFGMLSKLPLTPLFRLLLDPLFGLIGESSARHLSGLFFGLVIGLVAGLVAGLQTDIRPTEIVVWSWTPFRQQFVYNLVVVLVLGLAAVLLLGLLFGLLFGLAVGLLFGLRSGLSIGTLEKSIHLTPNQGIRRSAQNSIIIGPVVGLFVGLFAGLIEDQLLGLVIGLIFGLITGLIFGLIFGLTYGGLACIQQSVLRLLLWQAGYAPLRYVRFLDYATKHVLLRKVGGGYIFIHRILQEYFASLDVSPTINGIRGTSELKSKLSAEMTFQADQPSNKRSSQEI